MNLFFPDWRVLSPLPVRCLDCWNIWRGPPNLDGITNLGKKWRMMCWRNVSHLLHADPANVKAAIIEMDSTNSRVSDVYTDNRKRRWAMQIFLSFFSTRKEKRKVNRSQWNSPVCHGGWDYKYRLSLLSLICVCAKFTHESVPKRQTSLDESSLSLGAAQCRFWDIAQSVDPIKLGQRSLPRSLYIPVPWTLMKKDWRAFFSFLFTTALFSCLSTSQFGMRFVKLSALIKGPESIHPNEMKWNEIAMKLERKDVRYRERERERERGECFMKCYKWHRTDNNHTDRPHRKSTSGIVCARL